MKKIHLENKIYKTFLYFIICFLITLSSLSALSAWTDNTQHKSNQFTSSSYTNTVILTKRGINESGNLVSTGIKNVPFDLYKVEENENVWLQRYYTQDNGVIMIQSLVPGSYYFEEVNPPLGYDYLKDYEGKDITKFPFTIENKEYTEAIYLDIDNVQNDIMLNVSKEVKNSDATELTPEQLEQSFIFHVYFGEKIFNPDFKDDTNYTYTIDGSTMLTLKNGDSFSLKHGETASFLDLPYGLDYLVSEIDSLDYQVSSKATQGTLTDSKDVLFTNTLPGDSETPTGYVVVKKTVVNQDGSELTPQQLEKEFDFKVTFSDGGTYSYRINNELTHTIESGNIVSIKHNDSFTILNLPYGVTYTIEEIDYTHENYYSSLGMMQGMVTQNGGYYEYDVTNTCIPEIIKANTYDVAFRKMTVDGNMEDTFQFKITTTQTGIYYYTLNNGVEIPYESGDIITIKSLDQVRLVDLPEGTGYTIEEINVEGYTAATTQISGTVSKDFTFEFWNHKIVEVKDNNLIVKKMINGPTTDKEFEFELRYEDKVETFTLKNGEEKEFKLPVGTQYQVIEKTYRLDGYELTIENGNGTITANNTIHVLATNIYHQEWEHKTIQGEKTWDINEENKDQIPNQIEIYIMDIDKNILDIITVIPNDKNEWKYEVSLPKYDNKGNEIQYLLEEKTINGFTPTYTDTETGVDIKNTYQSAVTYTPVVTKEILGDTPKDNQVFKFMIENKDSETPVVHEVTSINLKGTANFSTLKFTQEGTYKYRIYEIKESVKGYTYDTIPVYLTIQVVKEDYSLVIDSVTYTKGEEKEESALFENRYKEEKEIVDPEPGPNPNPDKPTKPTGPSEEIVDKPNLPSTGIGSNGTLFYAIVFILAGMETYIINKILQNRKKY